MDYAKRFEPNYRLLRVSNIFNIIKTLFYKFSKALARRWRRVAANSARSERTARRRYAARRRARFRPARNKQTNIG